MDPTLIEYQGITYPLGLRPLLMRRRRALTIPLPNKSPNISASIQGLAKNEDRRRRLDPSPSLCPKLLNDIVIDIDNIQQTHDQQQSPLCRLPYEIRLMIWKYFLSDHLWHLFIDGKRRLCGSKCNEFHIRPCITASVVDHGFLYLCKRGRSGFITEMSILQSCRLIYSETVPLLYRDNMFDLESVDTLFSLAKAIPLPRLFLIRTVRLTIRTETMSKRGAYGEPRKNYRKWEKTCFLLSTMKGLDAIYLILKSKQICYGDELDAIFFPLGYIKSRVLELWVPRESRWEEKDFPTGLYHRPGFKIITNGSFI